MAGEDYHGAADLFAKAVSRDWQNTQARLFLARAHGMLGRTDACNDEIERLVQIARRNSAVLIEAGRTLAKFGQFERALAVYEKACERDGGSEALTRVAEAAERLSRLELAGDFAARAIKTNPNDHEARLVAVKVHRRGGHLDRAAEAIEEALACDGAPDPLRAKQWYERATVLDGLGDFAGAAESLTRAKACLQSQAQMFREPAEEAEYTLRRLVQELTPDRIKQWTDASESLPSARIAALVGFPRSGTTLLEQVLDAHPEIESVEETTHLSSELVTGIMRSVPDAESLAQAMDRVEISDVVRCRQRYLEAMAGHIEGPVGDRYILDKNPIRTLVMPILRRAVPDSKIIVALRDPRDVVLSNLMQAFDPSPMNLAFLDVEKAGAFYALNMEGWVRLRDLIGGWVEVRYEDVVVDESKQARRVLDLLGLEWNEELTRFRERLATKAVKSPTYAAVQEKTHTRAVRRWEHYTDYLAPAMPALERVAGLLGYA
jgi:tetratricopeptide (TPR) repeat protein